MKKKLLTLVVALFAIAIPLWAIVSRQYLTNNLKDLCKELQMTFEQRTEAQKRFSEDYERQHQKMLDVINKSNDLSILLYSQEQNMTFDLTYALKKVSAEYKDFRDDRQPYDRILNNLNIEIDRYGRLIEALRRLPPKIEEIEDVVVPDSLLYHNDKLELHVSNNASALENEVIECALHHTFDAPFLLDEGGRFYRDSCIVYASEILKIYVDNRATVMADSSHYQEAFLRLKEAHDYAQFRYRELEKYVFSEGQTPFLEIMANPKYYWNKTLADLRGQYDFAEMWNDDDQPEDSSEEYEGDSESNLDNLSNKGENAYLILGCAFQFVVLALFWLLSLLILWLINRFAKKKRFVHPKRLPLLATLAGTILYFGVFWTGDEFFQLSVKNINTFLWLLVAISGSLLLRVKPEQIRHCLMLYLPTILIALVIITCRIIFMPDRLLVLIFPPLLALVVIRQLFFCVREIGKATPIDSTLGWISLVIYIVAFGFAFAGYTFVALLVLVWWYFQLAALLSIVCVADLLDRYKERWLEKRVSAMRERITYVGGTDRESLLFGATWFYDLVKQVVIPAMMLLSLPMCIHLSLNVFDFNDLYVKLFCDPFVRFLDKNGQEALTISARSIVCLLVLFFVLRYVNRAFHTAWRYVRYVTFMHKHKRESIRANEINLSLANSLISVLVWFAYVIVVVATWKMPFGSLTLVAGGLSAGIGIALKDIINNFIYGIQLMGGRLRVGDWIECDGVRGIVTAVNYQCVQMETLDGTEMSFLNSTLFGKNFINLTRNNSYEFTKIEARMAYGTDIKEVREVLVKAMRQMHTKDQYGRDIVDPEYGIKVVVDDMADSFVNIAVKQFVLVSERIGYVDRSKEVIYEALNAAGIAIPFPKCDVHLVKDDTAGNQKQ